MDATRMLQACFEHQHPELYGREAVMPEFPKEASYAAEPIPPGRNAEGYVTPEQPEQALDSGGP